MSLIFPIDGDANLELVFIQFLGDRGRYEACCREAKLHEPHSGDLTHSERLAVWLYSSTDDRWYERINRELWNGLPSDPVRALAALLSSALSKLPVHDEWVFRGYTAPDFDSFVAQFDPGMVVRWPGFTSTTFDAFKAYTGNVLFIIKSKNGRILGEYADKPNEDEILFPAASRYLVLSVEREEDFAVIELEQVG